VLVGSRIYLRRNYTLVRRNHSLVRCCSALSAGGGSRLEKRNKLVCIRCWVETNTDVYYCCADLVGQTCLGLERQLFEAEPGAHSDEKKNN
jgi:hypothetical protein